MALRSGSAGWGAIARLLHWGMAALLLFQLGLGLRGAEFTRDLGARFELAQLHKSIGSLLLCLALLRILWRLADRVPAPVPMPRWQANAARISHAALYALMIALPVTGWIYAAASPAQDLLGIENRAFGLVLPDPWVPGDAALAALAHSVHAGLAAGLALLLVLHAAAALHHQFIARDRLLARMILGH